MRYRSYRESTAETTPVKTAAFVNDVTMITDNIIGLPSVFVLDK